MTARCSSEHIFLLAIESVSEQQDVNAISGYLKCGGLGFSLSILRNVRSGVARTDFMSIERQGDIPISHFFSRTMSQGSSLPLVFLPNPFTHGVYNRYHP